jgi:hypothetical protein
MTVLDTWPPGTRAMPKMWAYKILEARGVIRLLRVEYFTKTGRLKITYEAEGLNSAQARELLAKEAADYANLCAEDG